VSQAEQPKQASGADESTSTSAASAASDRGRRKVRTGIVVSDAMDKTVVVRISAAYRHPMYGKTVRRSSRFTAHDETNDAHVGDKVRIMETRPLSKTKRWRVLDVLERAK
jgi:small subunit ribosomal protein S17